MPGVEIAAGEDSPVGLGRLRMDRVVDCQRMFGCILGSWAVEETELVDTAAKELAGETQTMHNMRQPQYRLLPR
jgi:hypothetical protein